MNINKKRKSSENNFSKNSIELVYQKQEKMFYNMFSSIKNDKFERKKKLKSMFTPNIINFRKYNIKKNLESSINYSKNNYCGSFLAPDYSYVSGTKILYDLKSKGPEKTVNRYFSRDIPKADLIRNCKSISIRNKGKCIKSKYFNLINSNITRINRITSFKKNIISKNVSKLTSFQIIII